MWHSFVWKTVNNMSHINKFKRWEEYLLATFSTSTPNKNIFALIPGDIIIMKIWELTKFHHTRLLIKWKIFCKRKRKGDEMKIFEITIESLSYQHQFHRTTLLGRKKYWVSFIREWSLRIWVKKCQKCEWVWI